MVLPKVIEFGLLTDDALLMLKNIFSKVNITAFMFGVFSVSVSDLPA